jgi:hypothetical protein
MKQLSTLLLVLPFIVFACSPQQPASGGSSTVQPQLSPNETKISKQEFGSDWPFTVDEGILACKGSRGVAEVVFTANGLSYAVNGTAKGAKKYRPVEEVWAENPSLPGTKKNLSSIIDRGLKLCR